MSYQIEKARGVLNINLQGDPRFKTFPYATLFVVIDACNNVHPHPFSMKLVALEFDFTPPPKMWAGHPVLAEAVYNRAYHAGIGVIKPNDCDVSGRRYIELWEQAASKPVDLDTPEAKDYWKPHVTFGVDDDECNPLVWLERDKANHPNWGVPGERDEVMACIKRLNPEQSAYVKSLWMAKLETPEHFRDALYVFSRRWGYLGTRGHYGFSVSLEERKS